MRIAFLASLLGGLLSAGCVVGGGPTAGYGVKHGLFVGAEVSAGLPVAQASLGYQTRGHMIYGRADAAIDVSTTVEQTAMPGVQPGTPGARVGGGLGWSLSSDAETTGAVGMFEAGPSMGWIVGRFDDCDRVNHAFVLSIDLRYLTEWEIVVSPRL